MYFRAFHGVPDTMTAPDGTPVNAVRGFLDAIARLVTDFSPTALIAAFDADWRPAWRVDLVPSYKAHRVAGGADAAGAGTSEEEVPDLLSPQVPIIEDVLDAHRPGPDRRPRLRGRRCPRHHRGALADTRRCRHR